MTQFFDWMYVPAAQLKRTGVLSAQFIRWIRRTYISGMPLSLSLWELSSALFEFLLSVNSCLAWRPTQLLSTKFPPTFSSLPLIGLTYTLSHCLRIMMWQRFHLQYMGPLWVYPLFIWGNPYFPRSEQPGSEHRAGSLGAQLQRHNTHQELRKKITLLWPAHRLSQTIYIQDEGWKILSEWTLLFICINSFSTLFTFNFSLNLPFMAVN